MKVQIFYESKFGNGKKCVDYLGNVLSEKGHEISKNSIREVKPDSIPRCDLYIFSSPTRMGNAHGKMKKFLKKMNIPGEGKKYALIATYADPETKTLTTMEELAKSKGLTKATDGIKIKVNGMKGPLEDSYEEKLDEFASKMFSEE
jgi:menaquinone-dependent protoporphyrinogen IX oxidase